MGEPAAASSPHVNQCKYFQNYRLCSVIPLYFPIGINLLAGLLHKACLVTTEIWSLCMIACDPSMINHLFCCIKVCSYHGYYL